jgi:Ca-activated chloride channel family protein
VSFKEPAFLAALALVPLLAAAYVLMQRRRRIYAVRFTNLDLLAQVAPRRPGFRRHLPPVLFLLALAGLLTAAADPVLNLEVARERSNVMLVVDVSGSMQASDVQPSRLDAARSAARTLINQLPGSARVGLVSFNERATLVAPLTEDRQAVGAALEGLRPGGSTAIGSGLELALQQLQPARTASTARQAPSMIVLLTDGSSNAGIDPLEAAQEAKAAGIPVDTVGIGQRSQGTTIRGQPVDGVDEQVLQGIAAATGGKYYYAQAAGQLQQIYSSLGSQFAWQFMRVDIMIPLLALGLLVLVAGGALSLRWFRLLP